MRRHAGETSGFNAPVGPDAIDQRKPSADLVLRDLEHTSLLVEGARSDLRRVRVDRNRRQAFHRRHIAQVLAEARLVDCKIIIERQQHGRNYAVGNIRRVTRHSPSSSDRRFHARFRLASIAEFHGKTIGRRPHSSCTFLQRFYRQPPNRPGNADGPDDLATEIAHRQCRTSDLRIELPVIHGNAGPPHLDDLASQQIRRGNRFRRMRPAVRRASGIARTDPASVRQA